MIKKNEIFQNPIQLRNPGKNYFFIKHQTVGTPKKTSE